MAEALDSSSFDFSVHSPFAGVPGTSLNVIVAHDNVPNGTSLETYFTISGNSQAATPQVSEYTVLRTDRVTLGLIPALLRHMTYSVNGTGLRAEQLVVVDGTRGFRVHGVTRTTSLTLEQDVALLTSILMTFRPR